MNIATAGSSSDRVKVTVEGALCVALAVVFSYFKMFSMPQGGSVTLEMAPLLFFSYRHGFKWGAAAGMMTGFLLMLFGGYVTHPVQAALDYPLAFACLGIAGFFRARPALGAVVSGIARLVCHVLSGVIFFASYAPEGQNPWAYSTVYNVSYMVPSLLLSGVLAFALWKKLGSKGAPWDNQRPS
ncbi:MAG: energy-coupled thiamine transporter ThiT [Synergistaceae bacterium]|nr:energy-coupled thiamine transporter ThiT [Synergistaceae bacterium]